MISERNLNYNKVKPPELYSMTQICTLTKENTINTALKRRFNHAEEINNAA